MNFNDQNRSCHASPREASLCPSRETLRFAQGDNTLPMLVVKFHYRREPDYQAYLFISIIAPWGGAGHTSPAISSDHRFAVVIRSGAPTAYDVSEMPGSGRQLPHYLLPHPRIYARQTFSQPCWIPTGIQQSDHRIEQPY